MFIVTDTHTWPFNDEHMRQVVKTHGRRFGHPGEWRHHEEADEDDEDGPGAMLYMVHDPISDICMMARSREALARGWIDMLIAHARPRQTKGWATIRAAILKRDRYTCTVCGQSSATGAALHVDHILPVKLSGDDHPDNLRTLCDQCNLARAARPFDEFITKT